MYSRTSLKMDITNLSAGMTPGAPLLVDRSERRAAGAPTLPAHPTLLADAAFGRAEQPGRGGRGSLRLPGAVRHRVRRPVATLRVALVARASRSRRRVLVVRLLLAVALLLELLFERSPVRELLVRRRCLLEALQRRRRYYLLIPLCWRARIVVLAILGYL